MTGRQSLATTTGAHASDQARGVMRVAASSVAGVAYLSGDKRKSGAWRWRHRVGEKAMAA